VAEVSAGSAAARARGCGRARCVVAKRERRRVARRQRDGDRRCGGEKLHHDTVPVAPAPLAVIQGATPTVAVGRASWRGCTRITTPVTTDAPPRMPRVRPRAPNVRAVLWDVSRCRGQF